MPNNPKILFKAEYHPVLKTYFFLIITGWLIATVAGIIILPVWLIAGVFYCRKYFFRLECNLTKKTIELKKGYLFRVEKTIPPEKIQDLTLREGAVLRMQGLCILDIETAGQSSAQGGTDAKIIGIKAPENFREMVLNQKDQLISQDRSIRTTFVQEAEELNRKILIEIRDSLKNIERFLKKIKKPASCITGFFIKCIQNYSRITAALRNSRYIFS